MKGIFNSNFGQVALQEERVKKANATKHITANRFIKN